MTSAAKSKTNSVVFFVMPMVLASVVFCAAASAGEMRDEKEGQQMAALNSEKTLQQVKAENQDPAAQNAEVEAITYSLDDDSMRGPYGDGVYGK